MRFSGLTVLLTGASSGIGAAAARRFASEGARVALVARGRRALDEVAREIVAAGATAVAVPADLADLGSIPALVETVARELGTIDVLVNNAGANARGPLELHRGDELARVVTVNLAAPIVLTRLVLPYLRRSRAPAVVNVASLAGRVPLPHEAVYSATKFGLRAFSFSMADELAPLGIKVAVVSPGPVETGFMMDQLDQVPDLVLSQPMSSADDVARLIVDSAADGKPERVVRRVGGYLTTIGYLFPRLRRRVTPLLERRGRANRRRYRPGA